MKTVSGEDSELIQAHPLRLLSQRPRVEVVGVATEEEQAIGPILASLADAALPDPCLPPGCGLRVLEWIREAGCGAPSKPVQAGKRPPRSRRRRRGAGYIRSGRSPGPPNRPHRLAAQLSSGAEPSTRPVEPLSYSAMSRTFFWTATDPNRLSR